MRCEGRRDIWRGLNGPVALGGASSESKALRHSGGAGCCASIGAVTCITLRPAVVSEPPLSLICFDKLSMSGNNCACEAPARPEPVEGSELGCGDYVPSSSEPGLQEASLRYIL